MVDWGVGGVMHKRHRRLGTANLKKKKKKKNVKDNFNSIKKLQFNKKKLNQR